MAQAIAGAGLSAYYSTRSALAPREGARADAPADLAVYDLAEVQQPFVRRLESGARQATLLVEDITCGACVWLIESGLRRCEGVGSVVVNLSARRVHVEWDEGKTRLSTILRTLRDLGYRTRGFDPAESESAAARERRNMAWRLFVAGLGMMQVMMYAVPAYLADGDMSADAGALMRWASLLLTVPVVLWSAGPFFRNAWRELRARRLGMDVPVALGIAIAFAASAWATMRGEGAVYFDSITMFVFLLLGARWLEATARARAAESQQWLERRVPAVADRLVSGMQPATTERVPVARLAPGDLVLVKPGSIVPADGSVAAGASAVDESLLTGEAVPVAKREGDPVIGGCVNVASPLTVRVARVGSETVLAGIVRLMDRAQSDRPRIALVADRIAAWFALALVVVAATTALAWWWIEPARALWVLVAVLVVSCPCALSLATPTALAAATDTLHRLGILVTRGHALETLARATHVVFDKTGTLTEGRMSLIGVIAVAPNDRDYCLALAAALEHGSEHPVARAISGAAAGIARPAVTDIRSFPGRGVEAIVGGKRVRLGSQAFAAELTCRPVPAESAFVADDVHVVTLADEEGYLALLTLGDAVRPAARALVRELRGRGLTVCLLSGDRSVTVSHVARELGIERAVGEALPGAKLEFVRMLQSDGAVVVMVGDGVNDAPVLSQAQVAISMGGGTDLAHASADIVLLGDDLGRLPAAFDLSRDTMCIIRQNLAWAAAYNAAAIPLAAVGWITPLAAGTGMALSSLAVVGNALRLQRPGCRRKPAPAGVAAVPV